MSNCASVISKCFHFVTTRNSRLFPYMYNYKSKTQALGLITKKISCHITYSAASVSNNIHRVMVSQESVQTPGQIIDFELSVVDTHPSGTNRPTVVAIHGAPGSPADFDPLPQILSYENIRFVAPALPGNELNEQESWKLYHLDYTTDGLMEMMKQVLPQIGVERVSILMCHSAGSWLGYKMAAELDVVKSLCLFNPVCARPHRTLRPNSAVHLLAWLMHQKSLHFVLMPLLERIYAHLGFSGVEGGEHLVSTLQIVSGVNFKNTKRHAEQIKERQLPLLFFYTLNDKIIEIPVYEEMLFNHLDIPKELVTVVDSDRKLTKLSTSNMDHAPSGEKAWFAQVFQFERGGHIVHKSHTPIILNSIHQLLAHVEESHA